VNDAALTLLGTRGCHLCDDAEAIMRLAGRAQHMDWKYVDIAEDDELVNRYAERIPVLRRRTEELCWPFGVLDVLRFVRNDND
jgi:hypothetical protein